MDDILGDGVGTEEDELRDGIWARLLLLLGLCLGLLYVVLLLKDISQAHVGDVDSMIMIDFLLKSRCFVQTGHLNKLVLNYRAVSEQRLRLQLQMNGVK